MEVLKILSIIGISSIKFIGGPFLGYTYNFSFIETILFSVLGGMIGVLSISYFSSWILKLTAWIRHKRLEIRIKKDLKTLALLHKPGDADYHKKHAEISRKRIQNIFSPRNRKIVKYWKKFGLAGIALFTPIFISIPIGTFIATKYVANRKKVLIYMFCSLLFWAVLISSIFELFNNNI